jgi:hypothetical protein
LSKGSKITQEINDTKTSEAREELDRLRMMKSTGDFYFELPNGSRIHCANEFEYEELVRMAKPYIDAKDELPDYSWNDVVQFLTNSLNYYVVNKALTDIRRESEKFKDLKEKQNFDLSKLEIKSELLKQSEKLQKLVDSQKKTIDLLRRNDKAEAASLADYIEKIKDDCLEFANDHRGEFQWLTSCPNPDCFHFLGHKEFKGPIVVLQQAPHFAFDFAASPNIIWNQHCYWLTKKFYTPEEDWTEEEKKLDSGGISFKDAAQILRISPIGWLAAIWEKQLDNLVEFPINLDEVINDVDLLSKLIPDNESAAAVDDDEDD